MSKKELSSSDVVIVKVSNTTEVFLRGVLYYATSDDNKLFSIIMKFRENGLKVRCLN